MVVADLLIGSKLKQPRIKCLLESLSQHLLIESREFSARLSKVPIVTGSEKLKVVGFLGDKIVLSSMDNKKIIVLDHTTKGEFMLMKEE